jgi:AraC-like DNA-binding protein
VARRPWTRCRRGSAAAREPCSDSRERARAVLNRTREELARHYLGSSALTGAEISFLLGFEDPNSFFRAFHSWTGETPERVRTTLQKTR